MIKKVIAVWLMIVLTLSTAFTAFANSNEPYIKEIAEDISLNTAIIDTAIIEYVDFITADELLPVIPVQWIDADFYCLFVFCGWVDFELLTGGSGSVWFEVIWDCGNNPIAFIDPSGLVRVNTVEYATARGADVEYYTNKDGKSCVRFTYNGISQGYIIVSGFIDDTVLNARFGWESLLTDSQRDEGFEIKVHKDGHIYLLEPGLIHTPFKDSLMFGLAVGGATLIGKAVKQVYEVVTTPTPSVTQGSGSTQNKVNDLAKGIRDWLGNDARIITNKSGDRVIMSSDGLRKVRFDINNPSPHNSPHVHFEQLINGKWKPVNPGIPQIYPFNVPHN